MLLKYGSSLNITFSAFLKPSFCTNHDKSDREMMVLRIFLLTAWFYAVTAWSHRLLLSSIKSVRSVEVCTVIMKSEGVVSSWPLRLWWGSPAPNRPNWSLPALISKPQARLLYQQLSEPTTFDFFHEFEISLPLVFTRDPPWVPTSL